MPEAILLQDHADHAPRFWRRRRWRQGLAAADGISFCAREQAGLLAGAMQLPASTTIFEVPESTCRFAPGDKAAARATTGLHGDPCVLWVGNLIERKDPRTVLEGISRAMRELPDLQLWCCFATAPMRGEVERRIAADPRLAGRVHLLGRIPHERIETLMQAADLFVLGSRSEGSGYSVIEASNGNSALSKARAYHGPIHVLLTDVVMPGMGGRQLAELLADERPEMHPIFMSGYTDDSVMRHGVSEATVSFIQKPFSPEALARQVQQTLAGRVQVDGLSR